MKKKTCTKSGSGTTKHIKRQAKLESPSWPLLPYRSFEMRSSRSADEVRIIFGGLNENPSSRLTCWQRNETFLLTRRQKWFNNSLATIARVHVEPTDRSSTLRLRLGWHPLILGMLLIGGAFLFLLDIPALVLGDLPTPTKAVIYGTLPVLLIGSYLGEGRFLKRSIENVLIEGDD